MTTPDSAWLDSMYNNRLLVADFPQHLARWEQWSQEALRQVTAPDVPYGSGHNETLDIYATRGGSPAQAARGAGAPVMVFVHGGYWRSLDKKDFAFIGPAFSSAGACAVVLNYALCPGAPGSPVTVPDICLQTVKALAWVYRNIAKHGGDPQRITVIGHSAGGHLAGMLMACDWSAVGKGLPQRLVKNALAMSGLYEMQTIRQTPYLQESLRLTPGDAVRASPAWMAAPKTLKGRGRLYAVCGGDESAEFLRHNALIQQAWGGSVVPLCEPQPGLNHFSILEALVQPGHRLNRLARELLA